MESESLLLNQEELDLISDYLKLHRSKRYPSVKVIIGEESSQMSLKCFDRWMENELSENNPASDQTFIKELAPASENLEVGTTIEFDLTDKTREDVLCKLKEVELLYADDFLFSYVDYYRNRNQ